MPENPNLNPIAQMAATSVLMSMLQTLQGKDASDDLPMKGDRRLHDQMYRQICLTRSETVRDSLVDLLREQLGLLANEEIRANADNPNAPKNVLMTKVWEDVSQIPGYPELVFRRDTPILTGPN